MSPCYQPPKIGGRYVPVAHQEPVPFALANSSLHVFSEPENFACQLGHLSEVQFGGNALHTMVEASGCPELNQLGTLDATRVPNPWLWFLSCLHSFSVCCLFCFPLFNLSAQTMYAKV